MGDLLYNFMIYDKIILCTNIYFFIGSRFINALQIVLEGKIIE